MRFCLSDEDWALLGPLLPKSRKSARVDDRKVMNAIFCVLRTGMPVGPAGPLRPLHDGL
jgi:transposase